MATSSPRTRGNAVKLESLPGHYIRRLQQIAVALYLQETEALQLTPVQYAILQSIHNQPSIDQRTLARTIGLDTSTLAGVVDRLEARGLLRRNTTPEDRRVRRITITPEGSDLLVQAIPAIRRAQTRMLAPLPPEERTEFMRMLRVLVNANNEFSRAPSDA